MGQAKRRAKQIAGLKANGPRMKVAKTVNQGATQDIPQFLKQFLEFENTYRQKKITSKALPNSKTYGVDMVDNDNLSPAQKVIAVFPSFNEIMNEPKYHIGTMLQPFEHFAWRNSLQWEGVARAVNSMFLEMYERPFYEDFMFDEDTGVGSASVYPAHGDAMEVNFDEFRALTKVCIVMNVRLELTQKQQKAYYNFKCSDAKIYKILD